MNDPGHRRVYGIRVAYCSFTAARRPAFKGFWDSFFYLLEIFVTGLPQGFFCAPVPVAANASPETGADGV